MKFLILILLITPVATVVGQNNKLSIMISPNRAYRSYHSKQANIGKAWGANQQFKWGFSASLNYERRITKKMGLYTGIIFTNDGYQTKLGNLNFSDQLVSKDGYTLAPPSSLNNQYRFRYNYFNIGIPLGFSFYKQFKRINFFCGGGFGINYLIKAQENIVYYKDGKVSKTSKNVTPSSYQKTFNLSAHLNMGIEGKITHNYNYRVYPSFNYTLTNVMADNVIYKVYPYSFGLNFSAIRLF